MRRSQRRQPSRLSAWDKRYLWHPFTQQAEWESRDPIVIESARGVWLRDSRGRQLLDGNASLWVNVWGHHHPVLNRALARQLAKVAHSTFLGLTHEPAIRLARRLVQIAPQGLTRVFYSDNGSTAVEVALKMAYQYWQLKGETRRTRFVSMADGYHGDTIGSVSVGGVALFHERFKRLLFDGYQATPPPASSLAGGQIGRTDASRKLELLRSSARHDSMDRLLERHHREIAAVVMEPLIQGASGMLLMPKGYLAHAARLCRRYGLLLIVDEVATGFGRTGTLFACQQEGVSPDFLCVAKSLTAGYLPLAATLATEKIFRTFLGRYDEFRTFFHGHTYTANPLACAVAIANLDLIRRNRLLDRVRRRARQLADGLAPMRAHDHVREVRQLGLMCGIELVRDKSSGRPYPPGRRMGLRVCDEAIRRGVWLRPLGDVIVLMPPLAIAEAEMQFLVNVVHAAIEAGTSDIAKKYRSP